MLKFNWRFDIGMWRRIRLGGASMIALLSLGLSSYNLWENQQVVRAMRSGLLPTVTAVIDSDDDDRIVGIYASNAGPGVAQVIDFYLFYDSDEVRDDKQLFSLMKITKIESTIEPIQYLPPDGQDRFLVYWKNQGSPLNFKVFTRAMRDHMSVVVSFCSIDHQCGWSRWCGNKVDCTKVWPEDWSKN